MKFLTGSHQAVFVVKEEVVKRNAPLFLSRPSLSRQKSFHRALVDWYQDSGGFTQLQKYGQWTITAEEYVAESRRFAAGLGMPVDAWPRDCMTEPWVIFGTPEMPETHPAWFHGTHELRQCKAGSRDDNLDSAVATHQRLTAEDGVHLPKLAPELPFRKVLQGWTKEHYLKHIDMYEHDYGVDLAAERVVGVGSVCRRQATNEIVEIVAAIVKRVPGIRLHLFGAKIEGYRQLGEFFAVDENDEGVLTGDSMAWSAAARNSKLLLDVCRDDPTVRHKNCANCVRWAMQWRDSVLDSIVEGERRAQRGPSEWGKAA